MSSNHEMKSEAGLPLISVAGLLSGDPSRIRTVADAIGGAARQYGFFRICDHGIDLCVIEATYDAARRFFRQTDEAKRRYYIAK